MYTPQEAAFYAKLRTQTMNRWLYGTTNSEPVVSAELGQIESERIVTFLDFIQMLTIRAIRLTRDVPLQRIRSAVENAKKEYGVEFPLAMKHKVYLYPKDSPNAEVFIKTPQNTFAQISGKRLRQQLITKVAELHLDNISWDAHDMPIKYEPLRTQYGTVVMDPNIAFGSPIIEGSGYTAAALWEAYVIEGGIESAARCYGVDENMVKAAVEFYSHLKTSV